MNNINEKKTAEFLINFLKQEISGIGMSKAIIGLSGGVDSSLAATLLRKAVGKENVIGVIMPYKSSNPQSREHAELLANQLGIKYYVRDISPMVDAFFEDMPDADAVRRGNKMARERMCVLYDYSALYSAAVIGTSNKTEILMGYGTIFGDLASAINPLGDLYKTHIWQLAEYLEVPKAIIDKRPSADLWIGQTDEDELGYSYKEMDEFLYNMIDLHRSDDELVEMGYSMEMIRDIKNRIQRNRFKGRPPVIARIDGLSV